MTDYRVISIQYTFEVSRFNHGLNRNAFLSDYSLQDSITYSPSYFVLANLARFSYREYN